MVLMKKQHSCTALNKSEGISVEWVKNKLPELTVSEKWV